MPVWMKHSTIGSDDDKHSIDDDQPDDQPDDDGLDANGSQMGSAGPHLPPTPAVGDDAAANDRTLFRSNAHYFLPISRSISSSYRFSEPSPHEN